MLGPLHFLVVAMRGPQTATHSILRPALLLGFCFLLATAVVGLTPLHVQPSTQQVATAGMLAGPVTDGMRQLVLRGTRLTAMPTLLQLPLVQVLGFRLATATHLVQTALLGQRVPTRLVHLFLSLHLLATQSQLTQFT